MKEIYEKFVWKDLWGGQKTANWGILKQLFGVDKWIYLNLKQSEYLHPIDDHFRQLEWIKEDLAWMLEQQTSRGL